ncbi:hypothetical protein AB0M43_36490 [Longispora sp. NPDC051575]|uniref:hypothetical protein n=1 Tax=Longispora sp. NPDC051575 TaxID=3154943 RepID=UPI003421E01C
MQLFTAPGLRPVAVATQSNREGKSLINGAEAFCAAVWKTHFSDSDEPPLWIERQFLSDGPLNFRLVRFGEVDPVEHKLRSPGWRGLAPEVLAELVGQHVDGDRGPGAAPLPRPAEPELVYRVSWVLTLPRPQPFREPGCLPVCDLGLWGRLRRQAVADRRARSCCWYHGGDWNAASRTAIRLLHEAQAASVPFDEVHHHAMTSARATGVDGWLLEAVGTLLNAADGLVIDEDGGFGNGNHRGQVLIEQGVRRTVTLAYHWPDA